jgi:hypothetical protein
VLGTDRSLDTFSPKAIRLHDAIKGEWFIYGCAELKGLSFPVDAFVVAKREKENWYFSDIDGFIPRDSPWRRCGYDKGLRVRRLSSSDR